MPLKCRIITQERTVYEAEVDIVVVPGVAGEMGILPRHAPLLTTLDYGEVRVRRGQHEESFAVGGGVLQVAHNQVIILADSAERADDIDMARAEAARQRAQKTMAEGPPEDPAAYAALEAAIRHADLQIKVGRKGRGKAGLPQAPAEGDTGM